MNHESAKGSKHEKGYYFFYFVLLCFRGFVIKNSLHPYICVYLCKSVSKKISNSKAGKLGGQCRSKKAGHYFNHSIAIIFSVSSIFSSGSPVSKAQFLILATAAAKESA